MAYTVKVHGNEEDCFKVSKALRERIEKDGRFRARVVNAGYMTPGSHKGSRKSGVGFTLRNIRLTEAKPYCGQHAPPCVVNPYIGPQKKPRATYLEWEDWIEFNNLVNKVLDELHCDADVWSNPMEVQGRMWIRKGLRARIKYDYENVWRDDHWAPLQTWDLGSESQFAQ